MTRKEFEAFTDEDRETPVEISTGPMQPVIRGHVVDVQVFKPNVYNVTLRGRFVAFGIESRVITYRTVAVNVKD